METMQEKLIQFIHSLTDEECEIIVSSLLREQCDRPLVSIDDALKISA